MNCHNNFEEVNSYNRFSIGNPIWYYIFFSKLQMEEEIDDLVGELKYSDSSKSISTSLVDTSPIYSYDFSDSSPDLHNSSGKETYVLEVDDSLDESSSDAEKHYQLTHNIGSTNILQYNSSSSDPIISNIKLMNVNRRTRIEQETFTQTSKTIIELAENDGLVTLKKDTESLHTQTSCISITQMQRIHYTFEVEESHNDTVYSNRENKLNVEISDSESTKSTQKGSNNNEDESSDSYPDINSDASSKDNLKYEQEDIDAYWHNDNDLNFFNTNKTDSTENEYPKIADKRKVALSPVTEESTMKSIIDITPNEMLNDDISDISVNEIKIWPAIERKPSKDSFLPQIKNNPQPNLIFTLTQNVTPMIKSSNLPCLYNLQENNFYQNQKLNSYVLACGENFNNYDNSNIKSDVHLPPIENHYRAKRPQPNVQIEKMLQKSQIAWECPADDPISIDDKIKELKNNNKRTSLPTKSIKSPSSVCSELVERSCDALCVDILRRLKDNSWTQIVETLESLPLSLEKFWNAITEIRIAELLRQVTSIVESPRTQVAKSACAALAVILQHTSYVKKPEFYEAMSILINKTGSFSHPVRRAANLALDHIVCAVESSHAVSAICIYGVSHKSGLVRSASARLLVVTVALAQGGRSLLRSRPSSSATARQHLLRSLSVLLEDKNNETRRFAERLYKMLRPQKNFEAYFLNDVNLEVATRQMMKYDQIEI